MIYIKWNDLNEEAKDNLLKMAREHVEEDHGDDLKAYCSEKGADYEKLVFEESVKMLYTYSYAFNI